MIVSTTNPRVKYIRSLLAHRRVRTSERVFVVEGIRLVQEALNAGLSIRLALYDTQHLQESSNGAELLAAIADQEHCYAAAPQAIGAATDTVTPQGVVAVVERPMHTPRPGLRVILDNIQDPGNLGTIIRTADWYGIKNIVASTETAEFYNPKVIQATMGSFCRVNVFYYKLIEFISSTPLNVFGAYLNGANIHDYKFDSAGGGIFLLGNEANGISADLEKNVSVKISIPRFGQAESLNAGIATAVILDNWKRSI